MQVYTAGIFNKEEKDMIDKKRILSLMLALVMLLGCLSGCGKDPELSVVEVSQPGNANATGRYVEQSITLPDSD